MPDRFFVSGFVERGGAKALSNLSGIALDVQRSYPGATVTVYAAETLALATIFADASGTPKSNAFSAATDASWGFWAAGGSYIIEFSGAGIATPFSTRVYLGAIASLPVVDVEAEYGMTGAALQAAIDDAVIAGSLGLRRRLYLKGGVWPCAAEVNIPAGARPLIIMGDPNASNEVQALGAGTILIATASMRSVFAVLSGYHQISDLYVDADFLATHAMFLEGSGRTTLFRVGTYHGIYDGFHFSTSGNDNLCTLSECYAEHNGMVWATAGLITPYANLGLNRTLISGTASTTSGNATITIVGGTDLTALVPTLRKDDFIRVGNAHHIVESITATTVVVQALAANLPAVTAADQDFALLIGHGCNRAFGSDNNKHINERCLFRFNSSCGLNSKELYGGTHIGILVDANGAFGISIGRGEGISHGVIRSVFIGTYEEASIGGAIWKGVVEGLTSIDPEYNTDAVVSLGWENGLVLRKGRIDNSYSGIEQAFTLELINTAGTIQHRFASNALFTTTFPVYCDGVTGAVSTLSNTPTVDGSTPFVAGAGLQSGALHRVIFDNAKGYMNVRDARGTATVDLNDTGTLLNAAFITVQSNVNGVTMTRPAIMLTGAADGVPFTIDTTNIPAGKHIIVKVTPYMRIP